MKRENLEHKINNQSFETLQISIDHSVAYVTIDNPPVNVLDVKLMTELRQVLTVFAEDSTIKVIVFDSANPDFFIACRHVAYRRTRCFY